MSSRDKDEQRALDIVAGRATDGAANAPKGKSSLGGMEMAGILLWVLVLAGGGGVAAYYFLLAPK
jgi:hypothetical protein